MPWGRKGMQKVVSDSAANLAKTINKDDFLVQLKTAWRPLVARNTSIEEEVVAATTRIAGSSFREAFDAVGITDDDIRKILEEIREEPVVVPVQYESTKVDRNAPCSCGSGKKYKKCCGANAET